MLRDLLPCLSVLLGLLPAQAPLPQSEPAQRQFAVPLHDGSLQLAELLQGLLTATGLDGTGLDLPDARIDLRGAQGALLLFTSKKVLLDTVRFRRDFDGQQLLVTVDRVRTREVRRQLRARLAQFAGRLAGQDVMRRDYVLALPPQLDAGRPLVVLVHGVDSDAEEFDDLRAFLDAPPCCCQTATFAYPDDESIDRVAAALATRLRALGRQPIDLVGHSMGGLVAREVVENPGLDPGNVRTLVQLGSPNSGSNLAGLRFALEAANVLREADAAGDYARELLDAVLDHWRDGLGEAGGDLLPGSVFLNRLAARSRNPAVTYHLVLGTRSLLQPEQLAAVQDEVRRRLGESELLQLLRPRLQQWLADLDELVDGKDDGAVSVARGRLDGTAPVLVPLDHTGLVHLRGLLVRIARPEDHPVFARVAEWLDAAPPIFLDGCVVDDRGDPVPAAAVWITRDPGGSALGRVTSDGEGCFHLRLWPGGERCIVHAEAAGKVMAPLSNEGFRTMVLAMHDAAALTGEVRDGDGQPIAGATVAAAVASATSDAAGRFRLAAVPVGTLLLRAWSDGRSMTRELEIPGDTDVVLQLSGAVLRPRLLVAPDLPAEVRAVACFEVTGLGRLPLRADGTALLPVLPFAHEVRLLAPGCMVRPMFCRSAAGARDDLEFRAERLPATASLSSGRLVDAAGHGLAGHCVIAVDRERHRIGITSSGVDGAFAMRLPLAAGAHCSIGVQVGERLVSGADGCGWLWTDTTAAAEPLQLRLQSSGAIGGVATDRGGKPLAFAMVVLSRLARNRTEPTVTNLATGLTGLDGKVMLRGLADGKYAVSVRGLDGTVAETEVEVQVGAVAALGAPRYLPAGAIDGRLLDAAGKPRPGVAVRLVPVAGQQVRTWSTSATDRDGRFRIRGLLPGLYEVQLPATGASNKQVEIKAGAATTLELQAGR